LATDSDWHDWNTDAQELLADWETGGLGRVIGNARAKTELTERIAKALQLAYERGRAGE
jgi:hypothetical protein